jgi:hypothetical protein
MPGVVVTTAVRTGPNAINVAPASTFFAVGISERGATNAARLVTSLAEFEALYGGYTASGTLHQQVQTFFEEGGARAYIGRVVGAGATAGALTINDATDAYSALTLNAANVGAWSSNVEVTVTAGTGANKVLKLYYDDELIFNTGNIANAAAAATAINNSAAATIYVSATVNTASAQLETLATATPLTAGAAGASPTDAQLVTGLGLFDASLGSGAVAIPGQFSTTVYDGLLAHATTYSRIALLGFSPTATASEAITAAADYALVEGAEYLGFYFPHITMTGAAQTSVTISPEGYVAAKRSIAHNTVGSWQAAAGVLSKASFVTGLSTTVDKTTGDTLDEAGVNALRVIQGGVRVYGARSVSSDTANFRYITARDTLNYIVTQAEERLEDLVFSTIDGRRSVFGQVEARLIGLLEPLRTAGGLYEAYDVDGNQIDPGYSVEVTDALNPVTQLANGTVRAKVGVRVSSVADRIEVEVVKSNLTSSVV